MRKYIIQNSVAHDVSYYIGCNINPIVYQDLKFPIIWVYHHYLQSWLPREIYRYEILDLEKYQDKFDLLEKDDQIYWEELQSNYKSNGFVKIPNLLSESYCKFLVSIYDRNAKMHNRWHDMPGIIRTSMNDMPIMQHIHSSILKIISFITSMDIKPSYSFTSKYEAGSSLPKHTDRSQCEYNISLMLSSTPNDYTRRWPLHIITNVDNTIELNNGDAVLYLGTKQTHYRDIMPIDIASVYGVFFHFVNSNFIESLK